MSGWEEFVSAHFPAYLLPAAKREAIEEEEATRFLQRFAGDAADLSLVCGASLLADPDKATTLAALVREQLPALLRELPSRTEVERREWEGGFRGRLDLRRTIALHVAGERTHFATLDKRRRFDRPETILLRATLQRLLVLLGRLRTARVITEAGWGGGLLVLEPLLRNALHKSLLRDVPLQRIENHHLHAAQRARQAAFRQAAQWHLWLEEASGTPRERARHLARGALAPLGPDQRFELAVLLRLVQAMAERAEAIAPGRWALERCAIVADRAEVAALVANDGSAIRFCYNQAVLPAGPRDIGAAHYFDRGGRMRPDVTVLLERPGAERRAVVIEIKRSSDPAYLVQGFQEALLYRLEYGPHLAEWPKAILVAEAGVARKHQVSDEVIAVGWRDWAPPLLLDALLA